MATMMLTREARSMQPRAHRSIRELTGWNRRATLYFGVVGIACVVLDKVHP